MKNFIIAFLLILAPITAHSVEVVRLNIQVGSNDYDVDLELFDAVTPLTVQNFLNYVDVTLANPRYDGSFIHRSVQGFILQGGGFTFDPALGAFEYDKVKEEFTGGLQEVLSDAPVINEFLGSGLSNIRGTIAMAKVASQFVEGGACTIEGPNCTLVEGTGPDSATSEWFINLGDNSPNLDVQNEGFTVFGEVIGDGMSVFDLIENLPVINKSSIYSALSALPLENYVSGDVDESNLVRLNTIRQIQRPILSADIDVLDFGLVQTGESALLTVNIQNRGNDDLVISNSSIYVVAPYFIHAENCSNSTLAANTTDSCSITIKFEPVLVDSYNTQLQIIPAVNPYNVKLNIEVVGIGAVGVPDIEVDTQVDMGVSAPGFPAPFLLDIFNRGQMPLQFNNISLTGVNAADFFIDNNCPGTSQDSSLLPLEFDENCFVFLQMEAANVGQVTASLLIETNDPNEPLVTVNLSGVGDTDIDGVAAVIEQAAPNLGDANNDAIQDDVQNNVVSFVSAINQYITLATSPDNIITDFQLPENPDVPGSPQSTSFDHGIFKFLILPTVAPREEIQQVAVYLPQGDSSNIFYSYGPTPDNTTPHWYDFSYDGTTGAEYLGDVTIENADTGEIINRSMFLVRFLDGGRGDGDMVSDGKISNISAIGNVSDSSGTGSLAYWQLFLLVIAPMFRNFYRKAMFETADHISL